MTKQNFACPHPGCCYVGTQEDSEIHQREVHPEPSMDDGFTEEEIWGEKQGSGLSALRVFGTQCETGIGKTAQNEAATRERGDSTRGHASPAAVGPISAQVHTGTTLDALGDSVSRAFQNARPGPLQRIACTEAAKELDERYEREIQISELERKMPRDQE